jgi:hypothetical protein
MCPNEILFAEIICNKCENRKHEERWRAGHYPLDWQQLMLHSETLRDARSATGVRWSAEDVREPTIKKGAETMTTRWSKMLQVKDVHS